MDNKEIKKRIAYGRAFMQIDNSIENDIESDQVKKLEMPNLVKEAISDIQIDLPMNFEDLDKNNNFDEVIYNRISNRVYTNEEISLLELSYILYIAQGIKGYRPHGYATLRNVPSGGARHPFETYIIVKKVKGLDNGLYHYLPKDNKLEFIKEIDDMENVIDKSVVYQSWAKKASCVLYFTCMPYRSEWRYTIHAHRPALIDLGHLGQNVYLACSALNLGTCALAAYDSEYTNKLLGVDGIDEFTVYVFPIGTIKKND